MTKNDFLKVLEKERVRLELNEIYEQRQRGMYVLAWCIGLLLFLSTLMLSGTKSFVEQIAPVFLVFLLFTLGVLFFTLKSKPSKRLLRALEKKGGE